VVATAILLTALPVESFAGGRQEAELRILYTSSLNGNLDGCACGSTPRAGLVKRAAYLRAHRRVGDLLVDVGDVFDVTPDALLSRHILETYAELGYAAIAVGDQDFSSGIEALIHLRERSPLLCNNLAIRGQDGTETAFSDEPLLVNVADVTVGIAAVLDREVFLLYPQTLKNRLVLRDPAETVRRVVGDLRSRGVACVILLYHGTVESGLKVVSEVDGIDVMIVGHEQRLVAPRRVGSTIVASPGEEGNRVGLISLRIDPREGGVRGFTSEVVELSYLSDPDDPAVRARIDSYEQELRARIKERPKERT
jgi:2',3'-cyclic-nucleotide 2'-phosphodiesterase/3'-nucleotidase